MGFGETVRRWSQLGKDDREPETCITATLVFLAASFGHDDPGVDDVVGWLLTQQLADGGWNCESIRSGSTHGSFHTTISVLEALHAYERAGGEATVGPAMGVGRESLDHRLYRSHRTGEIVDPAFARFLFPPQWHFDVVRGLEHFVAAGAQVDERLSDGIDEVRRRQRRDGTWPTFVAISGAATGSDRAPRSESLVDAAGAPGPGVAGTGSPCERTRSASRAGSGLGRRS